MLADCRAQAMADQARDAAALAEMNRKFDALMRRYFYVISWPLSRAYLGPYLSAN